MTRLVTRRRFIGRALAAYAGMSTTAGASMRALPREPTANASIDLMQRADSQAETSGHLRDPADLEVHIFSKHLQFLDYASMAEAAAEIGFDGVDLTVRPGGHVEPARVEYDLPRAVDAVRRHGLTAELMTTSVVDADGGRMVLRTAADLGFQFYRTGWYQHPEDVSIPESLDDFRARARDLESLNREIGIRGGYQNHAGNYVGASIWELWELIHELDPAWLGCQYDIRHATVEGGLSWPQGLRLIRPFIQSIVAKDFRWTRDGDGWRAENVPIGEGMVDWRRFFELLIRYDVRVPLSLHLEYPIGGAEHGRTNLAVDREVVFDSMRRDLKAVKSYWIDAHTM